MTDTLTQACRLLGITRVAMVPAARQISAQLAAGFTWDQEFWFDAVGNPIGIYTPAEGLAALRRCVTYLDQRRA